jgi:hypothetical protein
METTPHDEPTVTTAHLPQPRGRARWRWSTPGRAALAGGTVAAVLGLGAGVAGATSSSSSASGSSSSSGPTSGATGRPTSAGQPPGGTRPTVAGRITALSGNAITLRSRDNTTTTVDYSARTTFTSLSAKGTSATSASALKVGAFIGVQGTTQSNGTVSASRIALGAPPSGGQGRPPGSSGRSEGAPPGASPSA